MNCGQCTDNLTAYMDGELSAAESVQMRAHLEICDSCTAELSGIRQAATLVESNLRELEVRPESWNAVYDRINAVRPNSSFHTFFRKWAETLAAAAVLVAISLGYLWYQHNERRSLDDYISRYVKSREAESHAQTAHYFVLNPFSESKPSADINPFRLEDR